MDIPQLLHPDRTIRASALDLNKKQLLEWISQLVASDGQEVKYREVLSALQQREKLGSTYMEHGVAIPHARVPALNHPVAALIVLDQGILYDDHQHADIILSLVVPEQANEEHIAALSAFADYLANQEYRQRLRHSLDNRTLYETAIRNPQLQMQPA